MSNFITILVLLLLSSTSFAKSFIEVCHDRYDLGAPDGQTIIVDQIRESLKRSRRNVDGINDWDKTGKRCNAIQKILDGTGENQGELLDLVLSSEHLKKKYSSIKLTDLSPLKEFAHRLKSLAIVNQKVLDYTSIDGASRLESLHIYTAGLREIPQIGRLESLSNFVLSGNIIERVADFDCYSSVRPMVISLALNKIAEIDDFGPSCKVTKLNLSQNLIAALPAALLQREELRFLYLTDNSLEGMLPVQARDNRLFIKVGGEQIAYVRGPQVDNVEIDDSGLVNTEPGLLSNYIQWGDKQIDSRNVLSIAPSEVEHWRIDVSQYRMPDLHFLLMYLVGRCDHVKVRRLLYEIKKHDFINRDDFINRQSDDGVTGFITAIQSPEPKCSIVANLLVHKSVDKVRTIATLDRDGFSPLAHALHFENAGITKIILEGLDDRDVSDTLIYGTNRASLAYQLFDRFKGGKSLDVKDDFDALADEVNELTESDVSEKARGVLKKMCAQSLLLRDQRDRLSAQVQGLCYSFNRLRDSYAVSSKGFIVSPTLEDLEYFEHDPEYRALYDILQGKVIDFYLHASLIASGKFAAVHPESLNQKIFGGISVGLGISASLSSLFPPANYILTLLKAGPDLYLKLEQKKINAEARKTARKQASGVRGNLIVAQKFSHIVAMQVIKTFSKQGIDISEEEIEQAAGRIFEYLVLNFFKISDYDQRKISIVIERAAVEISHNWDEINKPKPNKKLLVTLVEKAYDGIKTYGDFVNTLVKVGVDTANKYK